MGSILFCLTRPEALRAEAGLLHGMANFLDPSEEACPHCGQCLGDGAAKPLPAPFVGAQRSEHARLQEPAALEDGHKPAIVEGI